MLKRLIALLITLCLGLGMIPALAEGIQQPGMVQSELEVVELEAVPLESETEPAAEAVPASTEPGAFPPLNSQGFLDADEEFVYENPEEGIWRYASDTLRVEIYKHYVKEDNQTWFEAEIWAAEGETFHMLANNEDKRMTSTNWPADIAKKHGTVIAVNSDFAHLRYQQKSRMGVILRDGEILSEKTKGKNANGFPNLDTLALLPDGDMKVFWANELKGKDYQEMGAYDVLAFGPFLIRDGELNEAGLKKYGKSSAQRTAVGMVEPGHYFLMALEGRHSTAKGAGISFLAEKMYEKGCQVAFNLDGGQSATLIFMGKQIVRVGNTSSATASARKTAEILGIGTSETVLASGE